MAPIFHRRHNIQEDTSDGTAVLIVGLGNPGRNYRESRHNVGFMLIDRLAERQSASLTRVRNRALVGAVTVNGVKLVLAKPQTFMNLSGEAVSGLVRFYKIPIDHLLIIYDDIDLPFGTLRLRRSGSSAGHRGMQSIIERLGTQEFSRMRIGVGRPPGLKQGASYVLQDFSEVEREELKVILDEGIAAVEVFITQGIEQAMNQFNGPVFED